MRSYRQRISIYLTRYLKYYHYLHRHFVLFSKNKKNTKVFCIGYVKTGISSLYKALKILGYKPARLINGCIEPKEGWINFIKNSNFDAFSDYPIYVGDFFKKIDQAIPNSKFILTVRDEKSWEKSYANFYEISFENMKIDKQKFNYHNEEVLRYFKNKPSQLLIMNIGQGDGWEMLCNFLNKPIPNKPFPHKNIGKYKI